MDVGLRRTLFRSREAKGSLLFAAYGFTRLLEVQGMEEGNAHSPARKT
jgi:hypothetical protein